MSSSPDPKTAQEKAPPDDRFHAAVLTLVILTLLIAPDWVAYWGRSAYNSIPTLPDVVVYKPAQPLAHRIQQIVSSAIDRFSGSSEIQTLTNALIAQESGGNAAAQNHSGSGAMGLGQVMPENLTGLGQGWDFEALGRDLSQSEFLSSPRLQRQIIDHKVGQYWRAAIVATGGDKFTACQRVAAKWYSGDPNLYTSATPQYWNGDAYPSVAEYARSVCRQTGWQWLPR
jgi:hypothetical protein